jgi:hypothetical protein
VLNWLKIAPIVLSISISLAVAESVFAVWSGYHKILIGMLMIMDGD